MKKVLILIIILAAVYGAGVWYTGSHFLPGTYVSGLRLDGNGYEQQETIAVEPPQLEIVQRSCQGGDPVSETISSCVQLSYSSAELLAAQNRWLWFTQLIGKTELAVRPAGSYDEKALDKAIEGLYCFSSDNTVEPVSAHIEKSDSTFVIIPEDDGCKIDRRQAKNLIQDRVAELLEGENVGPIDLTDCYEKAAVTAQDEQLKATLASLNKLISRKITVTVSGGKNYELKDSDIFAMLEVKDNAPAVNSDKVSSFVNKVYKENYVSEYKYINKKKLTSALKEKLLAEGDATIKAVWVINTKKLIEVDLSEQTLYYYEDDKLIFTSPVVTGKSGDTPTGNYKVRYKSTDSTLVGKDYTNHVDYWIGFDSTGRILGFHDASWRTEFGGEIYKTDPSHGCVNMPLDKVKRLYNSVSVGTDVYIHK